MRVMALAVLFVSGVIGEAVVFGDPRPIHEGATGRVPAVRGVQAQVNPPPPVLPPEPVDGVCESWRPLFVGFGLPWSVFRPIMWRESRCTNAHADRPSTGDDSFGPLQVNRYGRLAAHWDELGFDEAYMATPRGAVHAAGNLHRVCGVHPWTDYECGWPNRAPTRWDWP